MSASPVHISIILIFLENTSILLQKLRNNKKGGLDVYMLDWNPIIKFGCRKSVQTGREIIINSCKRNQSEYLFSLFIHSCSISNQIKSNQVDV